MSLEFGLYLSIVKPTDNKLHKEICNAARELSNKPIEKSIGQRVFYRVIGMACANMNGVNRHRPPQIVTPNVTISNDN